MRVPFFLVLLLLHAASFASADIFGNLLGLGLAGCETRHKQLLTHWAYNSTSATLRATDATRACGSGGACFDQWCLTVDNSPSKLPLASAEGAGVAVAPCPKYDPHVDPSSDGKQAAYWAFDSASGQLRSLWRGLPNSTAPTAGLCLDHAASGMLELTADCANASRWVVDNDGAGNGNGNGVGDGEGDGKLRLRDEPATAGCVVAVNTTTNDLDPFTSGAGNCTAEPHSLLPYCDVANIPLEQRISNVLSHAYLGDLPAGFRRLGFPIPPTGECLHGFVTDCVDSQHCATIFPSALSSAGSFNDTLFELIGAAISTEGRAVDNVGRAARAAAAAAAAASQSTLGAGNGNGNGNGNPIGDIHPHGICWSPNINPFRHPLWGRGQETPGEDPLLCGKYGAAYVRGLQGEGDPAGKGFLRLAASPKHFAGYDLEGMSADGLIAQGSTYSGPTFTRHNFTARVSAQELVEYYAKPFRHAIEEGRALGIMCSYNALDVFVDGGGKGESRSTGSIPACAFTALQDGMMRGQWNFTGQVVSDCGAIADFMGKNDCSGCSSLFPSLGKNAFIPTHGLCNDVNYTAQCPACDSTCLARSMYGGGTDTACGVLGDQISAVRDGSVTKAQLAASARRVLRQLMSIGLNVPEADRPYAHLGLDDVGSPAATRLNLEAARQSIVLVKNEPASAPAASAGSDGNADNADNAPVLPIAPGSSVAVLGPLANSIGNYLSNYHPPQYPDNNTRQPQPSPFEALLAAGVNATYQEGAKVNLHGHPTDEVNLAKAVAIAAGSDAAVVFVGLDAGQEHESGDRNQTGAGLSLPGSQQELVEKVLAANPRTAVVLVHGSPIAVEWIKDNVPAVLDAHYPGAMGGQALADVLTGAHNPAGRLTTTVYPAAYGNRSIFDTALRANGGQTYMHYDPSSYGEPLWEFGHGLSYANFTATASASAPAPQTATTGALAASPLQFAVDVRNGGGPDGAFSALGFIASRHAEAPRNRRLFGYARAASIAAGATATMTVELSAATAALVEADGTSALMPGSYNVTVAGVTFPLELTGPAVVVAPAPPLFL